jgi:hypothetical protein
MRAIECSTCTLPRSLATSSAEYDRVMPFQRGEFFQVFWISDTERGVLMRVSLNGCCAAGGHAPLV